jgi:hypothetical protein
MKNLFFKTLFVAFSVTTISFISGCSSISVNKKNPVDKGSAVVIGRWNMLFNNEKIDWHNAYYRGKCRLILNENKDHTYRLDKNKDGFFAIIIPIESDLTVKYGEPYTTFGFTCKYQGQYTVILQARLLQAKVPRTADTVYIFPALDMHVTDEYNAVSFQILNSKTENDKTIAQYQQLFPYRTKLKEKFKPLDLSNAVFQPLPWEYAKPADDQGPVAVKE